MRAYDIKAYQIEGPAWIGTYEFDVMARIPRGVSADKIPAMLQALLAARFAVKLHKKSRNLPTCELSVTRGGPGLKEIDAQIGMSVSFARNGHTIGGKPEDASVYYLSG
jgi:uncharacterized protein (TIGR03435 family)